MNTTPTAVAVHLCSREVKVPGKEIRAGTRGVSFPQRRNLR